VRGACLADQEAFTRLSGDPHGARTTIDCEQFGLPWLTPIYDLFFHHLDPLGRSRTLAEGGFGRLTFYAAEIRIDFGVQASSQPVPDSATRSAGREATGCPSASKTSRSFHSA